MLLLLLSTSDIISRVVGLRRACSEEKTFIQTTHAQNTDTSFRRQPGMHPNNEKTSSAFGEYTTKSERKTLDTTSGRHCLSAAHILLETTACTPAVRPSRSHRRRQRDSKHPSGGTVNPAVVLLITGTLRPSRTHMFILEVEVRAHDGGRDYPLLLNSR